MFVCYSALKRAFEQLSRAARTWIPSSNNLHFLSFYLTFSHATHSKLAFDEPYRTLTQRNIANRTRRRPPAKERRSKSGGIYKFEEIAAFLNFCRRMLRGPLIADIAGYENARPSSNISF